MSMCHCDGPPHPYDPSWCRPRLAKGEYVIPGSMIAIYIDPRYFPR